MTRYFIFLMVVVSCSVYGMRKDWRVLTVSPIQQMHLETIKEVLKSLDLNREDALSFVARRIARQANNLLGERGGWHISSGLLLKNFLKESLGIECFSKIVRELGFVGFSKDYKALWEWCKEELSSNQKIRILQEVSKKRREEEVNDNWLKDLFCGLCGE